MFKTKKSRRNFIIAITSIAISIIVFFILKVVIRGDISATPGGEMFVLVIPLIVYVFIKNWKLFMETCFPKDTTFKDTTFDDYFDEYFTGKDMIEDKPSNVIGIDDFITR